jgi:hypothetical protein
MTFVTPHPHCLSSFSIYLFPTQDTQRVGHSPTYAATRLPFAPVSYSQQPSIAPLSRAPCFRRAHKYRHALLASASLTNCVTFPLTHPRSGVMLLTCAPISVADPLRRLRQRPSLGPLSRALCFRSTHECHVLLASASLTNSVTYSPTYLRSRCAFTSFAFPNVFYLALQCVVFCTLCLTFGSIVTKNIRHSPPPAASAFLSKLPDSRDNLTIRDSKLYRDIFADSLSIAQHRLRHLLFKKKDKFDSDHACIAFQLPISPPLSPLHCSMPHIPP